MNMEINKSKVKSTGEYTPATDWVSLLIRAFLWFVGFCIAQHYDFLDWLILLVGGCFIIFDIIGVLKAQYDPENRIGCFIFIVGIFSEFCYIYIYFEYILPRYVI